MKSLDMLLEEDKDFLVRKGFDVGITRDEQGVLNVVIHDFKLSSKFNPQQTELLIRLLPGYPDVGIDMFWTKPDVVFADNNQKPPATETHENHIGVEWQRWSRHMDWRAGVDALESFFTAAISKELLAE